MIDQHTSIDQLYYELVEWASQVLTQYSIQDLWRMDCIQFMHLLERAKNVQKAKMKKSR